MNPAAFKLPNTKQVVYAENQPEYKGLPCVRLPSGDIATRWVLDEKERELIAESGEFYLCISTFNQPLQPLMPMADRPEVSEDENGKQFFYSPLEWRREQGIAEDEIQIDGLPAGYRDKLTTDTEIHFGFWDRVKILFGWKVELRCKTYVQYRPGKCYSESNVSVYRPRNLPEGWGTAEAAPMEEVNGKQ
jgi:hypothetical protein